MVIFLALMVFEETDRVDLRLVIRAAVDGNQVLFVGSQFIRFIIIGKKKHGIYLQSVGDYLDLTALQVNTAFFIFCNGGTLDTDKAAKFLRGHIQFFPAGFDLFANSHRRNLLSSSEL